MWEDLGLIPGSARSAGEGKDYLLQYSGLENSMDCIVHGVTKSQTWLSDFHFHFLLSNRNSSSCYDKYEICVRVTEARTDYWLGGWTHLDEGKIIKGFSLSNWMCHLVRQRGWWFEEQLSPSSFWGIHHPGEAVKQGTGARETQVSVLPRERTANTKSQVWDNVDEF